MCLGEGEAESPRERVGNARGRPGSGEEDKLASEQMQEGTHGTRVSATTGEGRRLSSAVSVLLGGWAK